METNDLNLVKWGGIVSRGLILKAKPKRFTNKWSIECVTEMETWRWFLLLVWAIGSVVEFPLIQTERLQWGRLSGDMETDIKSLVLLNKQTNLHGLLWWLRGKEYNCQFRRHRFDPWSEKIPHAVEQLRPYAPVIEPCSRVQEPQLPRPRAATAEARTP